MVIGCTIAKAEDVLLRQLSVCIWFEVVWTTDLGDLK